MCVFVSICVGVCVCGCVCVSGFVCVSGCVCVCVFSLDVCECTGVLMCSEFVRHVRKCICSCMYSALKMISQKN